MKARRDQEIPKYSTPRYTSVKNRYSCYFIFIIIKKNKK